MAGAEMSPFFVLRAGRETGLIKWGSCGVKRRNTWGGAEALSNSFAIRSYLLSNFGIKRFENRPSRPSIASQLH